MKEIKAYIKPHKFGAVTLALHGIEGLTGMSLTEVRGFGRSKSKDAPHRHTDDLDDSVPHVKIEIMCRDELVETVVNVIQKAAHTGLRGDGKVFVLPVETALRIQTGERGQAAV
jgi:nitrogen regulatory protein P-II 1